MLGRYNCHHVRHNVLYCVQYKNKTKCTCWRMFCVACCMCHIFFIRKCFILQLQKKKKKRKLLTLDQKCTCVGTFPITWWYNSDQWHLPFAFRTYAYLMVPDIILPVTHPVTLFSWIWHCNSWIAETSLAILCWRFFCNNDSVFCSSTY
jgi:hypothetical protein